MKNMVLGVPAFAGMTRVIGKEEEVPAFARSDSYRMTISGGGVREDSGFRRNRPK